ncbi:hypothetical protein ABPG72_000072 [Tetrahymena utriculariae]
MAEQNKEQQLKEKIEKLKQVLTKNQLTKESKEEQKSDLEIYLEDNDQLKKALDCNKFASLLTKSGDILRGEKFFLQGIKLIEEMNPPVSFSNIYLNLGNLYAQKRDYQKAIEFYLKTIQKSPYNNEINNQNPFQSFQLDRSLNNKDAYLDAYTNIAVMYVNSGEKEKSYEYCIKAIELNPDNKEALINLGDILRQLGRKNEAISITWSLIEKLTNKNNNKVEGQSDQYIRPNPVEVQLLEKGFEGQLEGESINILCVKWGTRYDSEYVNKLYRGIKKNTILPFTFYCFTEDSKGLDENIVPIELMNNWKRWWGKATLFSLQYKLKGNLNFYIDLDMIITGNIDNLLKYKGGFAILKTEDLACEKYHKDGYNSSIMIWDKRNVDLERVYIALKENFEQITQYIVRFDYWLEMMINNADFIQDVFPTEVSDYLNYCQNKLPENTRIVCFPRKPKPEDYPSDWIKEYWI